MTTVAVFYVLVLYGCGQKKINTHEIIHLETILDNFVTVNLSEFADSIEYIKLETNDQTVISRIKQIDITKNLILIQDNEGNCILFKENGKFLSRIGKKGNGPGEYQWLEQGKIGNHVVFVLSGNKILTYNFKGEFLQQVNIPYRLSSSWWNNTLFPNSDTTFLLHVPTDIEQYKLIEFNLDGSMIQKYSKKQHIIKIPPANSICSSANIYIHDGRISYKERLNDTLFRIHNSLISPEYIFNIGAYTLLNEANESGGIELKNDKYCIDLMNFVETTDYFFLSLSLGANSPKEFVNEKKINNEVINVGYRWLGIYNKKVKTLRLSKPSGYNDELNYTGIYNDLDGGLSVFPMQRIDDSGFITWFYPYELKSYTSSATFRNKEVKNQEMKDKLMELSKSLSFEDNPVLVRIRMKK